MPDVGVFIRTGWKELMKISIQMKGVACCMEDTKSNFTRCLLLVLEMVINFAFTRNEGSEFQNIPVFSRHALLSTCCLS